MVDRDQIGIISRIKIRECLIKFDYCIRGNVEFWINDEQINSGFNNLIIGDEVVVLIQRNEFLFEFLDQSFRYYIDFVMFVIEIIETIL